MEESELQEQLEEMQKSRVATEDASYHAIRIYNMLRDRLWEKLEAVRNSGSVPEIRNNTESLRLLLVRGNNTWLEIKKAIEEKKKGIKATFKEFPYDEELKEKAGKLNDLIRIMDNPKYQFILGNQLAIDYLKMPLNERLSYLKNQIEGLVTDADNVWGNHAALIGFTMPIEVKETHDPFL